MRYFEMLWIVCGVALIIASGIVIILRHFKQDHHLDSYLASLFGWPSLVSGVLLLVPTFIWYDFAVGFIAMAAYEGWRYLTVKRKHAEHDFAKATTNHKETA